MSDQAKIEIPLDVPDVRVIGSTSTRNRELIIAVESTLTTATCRTCGKTISSFYGYSRPIRLRHLPSFGLVVYIEIRPKRFRCPFCDHHPTTTQRLSWYEPKAVHTKAYEQYLLLQLINSTIADVCRKEDLTPDALEAIVNRWLSTEVDWRQVKPFSVLGIDEIALTKGQGDYVAVLTARRDTGEVEPLAVLQDRKKETVRVWLATIPKPLQRQIATVCTDSWEGYISAVREALPKASIVIDRFHVAKQYRDGADTLRKSELKRLRAELGDAQAKTLKGTLWPFRKRARDLTEEEQQRLEVLFEHSPQLKQAYDLREELSAIFDTACSKAEGLRRIKGWCRKVRESGLSCYDRFLKLLDTWLTLIANYFRHRHSSGFVEGVNNKLKVLKRRCFGITNLGHLFQRITLDFRGYERFSPWQTAYPYM
ncbi:MAG: ISL3 family transposase [Burkholderiaceae bacterium]